MIIIKTYRVGFFYPYLNPNYMKKNKILALLLCFSTATIGAYAIPSLGIVQTSELNQQVQKIKGTILDARTGEPIIGASILIKDTAKGTITDFDGHFSLDVALGKLLRISYIGFDTVTIAASDNLVIKLVEDAHSLDEVIVVGYSSMKKESLTGSMQSIKNDKLTDITTPNVENMLNGKIPGVFVAPGSGQPGSAGAIVIRGKSTINGSTAPLWVVDGVIVGSSAGSLNPDDVETMTVLKDAASTAIYGSQGANGVILITTKSASSGKIKVNFSSKIGFTTLYRGNMKMMNGAELYDLYNSFSNVSEVSFPRWNEDLRNSNFSWWNEGKKTGIVQDYNVSLQGGSEQLKGFLSVGVYDETGAVKGYDYKRYSFRTKTTYKPFEFLTIKPSLSGSLKKVNDKQHSVTAMNKNLPWDNAYDKEGKIVPNKSPLWVNSNSTNYLYDLQWNHSNSDSYQFDGNFDFDIKLTDNLTFASVNSYRWTHYESLDYSDPRSSSAEGVNGRLNGYQSTTFRRYTNQILRYNQMFGDHSINALAAYEFNDYTSKTMGSIGTGFVPGFEILNVTAKPEKVSGAKNEWAVQSVLFNANYAYKNKYLAQLSLRRDGASNFGRNKSYGNFFSISAGWNINREDWFNADWVDNLKLRASYGSVGSRPNSLYPQYDLYSVSGSYNEKSGALISQIGNDNLTWEKTYTSGLGLESSFFGRLRASFDFYIKNTSNLLYAVPVSGLTGVTSVWRNVGELKNTGFETTLGADIIKNGDWLWSVDVNLGTNSNEIVSLYGGKAEMIIGDGSGIAGSADKMLRKGLDSDSFYLREWAGVDPQTGAPQWWTNEKDDNGKVISREKTSNYSKAEQVVVDASTPDLFGGINTYMQYKKFDLSANFGFSTGGKIYNYARQEYDSDGAYTDRNQMKLMSNWSRWEKPGDIATHPVASYNNSSNSQKVSSRFLEDGDYFKMRSLTLGYNFTFPQFHISNLRVFASAENLFCITDYSGVDPELPAKDSSLQSTSSPSAYPATKKVTFGFKVTF